MKTVDGCAPLLCAEMGWVAVYKMCTTKRKVGDKRQGALLSNTKVRLAKEKKG